MATDRQQEVHRKLDYLGDGYDGNMQSHAEVVRDAYDALLTENERLTKVLRALAEYEPTDWYQGHDWGSGYDQGWREASEMAQEALDQTAQR